jgi:hypothetical protein
MYYRIATQHTSTASWRWVSTSLGSLNSVIDWLRFYSSLPRDRLRVFSASSREDLNERLLLEDQGLVPTSISAARLLSAASDRPREAIAATRQATTTNQTWGNLYEFVKAPEEAGTSPLDARRDELERGAGGDHDCPYRFSLPDSTSQLLAWARLLARVLHGDLQAETFDPGAA